MKQCLQCVTALFLFLASARAGQRAFDSLMAAGDGAAKRGDFLAAQKCYLNANQCATNCADLCLLTRRYCDLAHLTNSTAAQKKLAEAALNTALRAVAADSKNATAHLCVAVGCVKNFPYARTREKVQWSRTIQTECETALSLNPKQDVGYYLLGRWNFEMANVSGISRTLAAIFYGGLPQASNAEAIKDFKKAIDLAPNRIIHHAELARVYDSVGNRELALAEFKKCRALKPTDADDVEAQQDAGRRLAKIEK